MSSLCCEKRKKPPSLTFGTSDDCPYPCVKSARTEAAKSVRFPITVLIVPISFYLGTYLGIH